MAQKYTQNGFKSFYNIVKMNKYGELTPFTDMKGNMTAFKIKVNGNLVTVSVNGRISVEKNGRLIENGRYYGVRMGAMLKEIVGCCNFC